MRQSIFSNRIVPASGLDQWGKLVPSTLTSEQIPWDPRDVLRVKVTGDGGVELLAVGENGRHSAVAVTVGSIKPDVPVAEDTQVQQTIKLGDYDEAPTQWPTHLQLRIRAGVAPVTVTAELFREQ